MGEARAGGGCPPPGRIRCSVDDVVQLGGQRGAEGGPQGAERHDERGGDDDVLDGDDAILVGGLDGLRGELLHEVQHVGFAPWLIPIPADRGG